LEPSSLPCPPLWSFPAITPKPPNPRNIKRIEHKYCHADNKNLLALIPHISQWPQTVSAHF
jgi:hypothetical protein